MSTLALVESPAQLVNVCEWAAQTGAPLDTLTTVVLAPSSGPSRRRLGQTTALAEQAGHTVRRQEAPRCTRSALRALTGLVPELRGVDRLVAGDPFSATVQLVLGLLGPRELVLLDPGTATAELAPRWTTADDPFRGRSNTAGSHRRCLAALARRRVRPGSGCRVTAFTCLPVPPAGFPVVRNRFSWVRGRYPAPPLKPGADLVGTCLVETGAVEPGAYLRGLAVLVDRHGVDRYLAHPAEERNKLAAIASLGVEVVCPDVPLELAVRRDPVGRTVVGFPSAEVHTLPLVLRDTGCRVLVCDPGHDRYAGRAAIHFDRFPDRPAGTATDAHGLGAVAC